MSVRNDDLKPSILFSSRLLARSFQLRSLAELATLRGCILARELYMSTADTVLAKR
jgi:hypothetical protein